jgi:hypothetical protein
MVEEHSRMLGVPLDAGERDRLGPYAKALIERDGATRRQMLLWAAHYSTRRSENPQDPAVPGLGGRGRSAGSR